MSEVHTVCESIKAHLPAILNDWCSTAEFEPWISVPPEHRASNLYQVAMALVEVATGGDDTAQLRSVLEAARHGEQRRHMGFPESVLLSDFQLLRLVVWRDIQQNYGHAPEGLQTISRIDTALTLATVASLRGYHRSSFAAHSAWPEHLQQWVHDWPASLR